jgi:hypothetical protein
MESPRTGHPVANQFTITTDDGLYFQSYRSIIAFIPNINYMNAHKSEFQYMKVFLDATYWDYSVTTSKYRNAFLNDTTKGIKEKIKTGYYELVDLNK